jgi:hypothetical protein
MPRVSIWLIRASLIHMLSGAMLGVFYMWLKVTGWPLFAASHRPVHIEQMLIGWMVQLVMGVAFWILPRRPGQASGRSDTLMWVVFGLLNGGILLAALGGDPALPSWIALPGRMAEALAVLLFASHAWTRQRAYSPAAMKLIV